MAAKISIIDDNENILISLALQLQNYGYTVSTFSYPQQALDHHVNEQADFYIIDINMPKISGIDLYKSLCQKLEAESLPAVFLTGASELETKCLEETSISDFIKKPFNFDILHARIKKILSRYKPFTESKTYKIGNLKLNEDKMMCQWFNKEIELTKKEFLLLSYLVRRPRTVFTRTQLLDLLDINLEAEQQVIDSHIKRIRKKFEETCPEEKFKVHKLKVADGENEKAGEKVVTIGRVKFLISFIQPKENCSTASELF